MTAGIWKAIIQSIQEAMALTQKQEKHPAINAVLSSTLTIFKNTEN